MIFTTPCPPPLPLFSPLLAATCLFAVCIVLIKLTECLSAHTQWAKVQTATQQNILFYLNNTLHLIASGTTPKHSTTNFHLPRRKGAKGEPQACHSLQRWHWHTAWEKVPSGYADFSACRCQCSRNMESVDQELWALGSKFCIDGAATFLCMFLRLQKCQKGAFPRPSGRSSCII